MNRENNDEKYLLYGNNGLRMSLSCFGFFFSSVSTFQHYLNIEINNSKYSSLKKDHIYIFHNVSSLLSSDVGFYLPFKEQPLPSPNIRQNSVQAILKTKQKKKTQYFEMQL